MAYGTVADVSRRQRTMSAPAAGQPLCPAPQPTPREQPRGPTCPAHHVSPLPSPDRRHGPTKSVRHDAAAAPHRRRLARAPPPRARHAPRHHQDTDAQTRLSHAAHARRRRHDPRGRAGPVERGAARHRRVHRGRLSGCQQAARAMRPPSSSDGVTHARVRQPFRGASPMAVGQRTTPRWSAEHSICRPVFLP